MQKHKYEESAKKHKNALSLTGLEAINENSEQSENITYFEESNMHVSQNEFHKLVERGDQDQCLDIVILENF